MSIQEDNQLKVITKSDSSNNLAEVRASKPDGQINLQTFLIKYIKIKNQTAREFIAETFGTFMLILIGCSGVAQYKLSSRDNPNSTIFLSVNMSFGFGALVAILLVGKVSGAHLNPAVSLAMLLTGRLTILKFILYSFAQTLGAFLGALAVFILYLDALKTLKDMYSLDIAGIFATYPSAFLSTFGGFFDQVVSTAVLVMVVLAINDKKNVEMPHGTSAILVSLLLIVIGCTMGYNCGYAINPARDFGPRMFTLIAGWGAKTFSAYNYFFWIPIIAPMIGSIVGTLFYLILISNNL